MGISRLPSNLAQAIELAERSDLVRGALGDRMFDSFVRNKRIEWEQYERAVTDYEIAEYLGKL